MKTKIDAYLVALPSAQREMMLQLRERVHAVISSVDDAGKTRNPALRYKGNTVVGLFTAARYLASYVMLGDSLRAAPLPAALVRKLVRFRLAEVDERP